MTVRQLSLMANEEINLEGTAETQKLRIKEFLKKFSEGLTRNELSRLLGYKINAVIGRVNSLIKEGSIEETGQRRDIFSNKLNYVLKVII